MLVQLKRDLIQLQMFYLSVAPQSANQLQKSISDTQGCQHYC